MYVIKVNKSEYTIPDNHLKFAAQLKAIDFKDYIKIETEEDAIKYFKTIGAEVYREE